jgi:hypoxanthine phosphoribosyltransferase
MGILSDELGVERVIYSEETIKKRITELGEQIAKDYAGQELIVIGLIRGAMYFLADLTRAIDLPIKVDMIGFTNIPDTTSKTGVVRIIKDIELDIAGKNVLVVEDIIRTGLTTAYIIQNLEMKRPKEIRLCSMLVNPDRLLMTIPVHYCGFEINDNWLAGYGLDREEIGRNLPYIVQIKKRKE